MKEPRKSRRLWLLAPLAAVVAAAVVTIAQPAPHTSVSAPEPERPQVPSPKKRGIRRRLLLLAPVGAMAVVAVVAAATFAQAIPPIKQGDVPPHGPRGACTDCHTVLADASATSADSTVTTATIQALTNWNGAPTTITRDAEPPHEPRGVCTDCHDSVPQVTVVVGPGMAGAGPSNPWQSLLMAGAQAGGTQAGGTQAGGSKTGAPPHGPRGTCTNCHASSAGGPSGSSTASGPYASGMNGTGSASSGSTTGGQAVPPHGPRGTCTACHGSTAPTTKPSTTPTTQTNPPKTTTGTGSTPTTGTQTAVAPHPPRGTCTNCHSKPPRTTTNTTVRPPKTTTTTAGATATHREDEPDKPEGYEKPEDGEDRERDND